MEHLRKIKIDDYSAIIIDELPGSFFLQSDKSKIILGPTARGIWRWIYNNEIKDDYTISDKEKVKSYFRNQYPDAAHYLKV